MEKIFIRSKLRYLNIFHIVPERRKKSSIKVDIYDKSGNYIETLNSIKEVKEKYKVPASKIKNIERGNRYFGDWIFKYHNSK